jgi:hypothetical protein
MNPPDQPTDTNRRARIAHAESLGYVRCEPYASIGDKTPRWGKDGSYYSFAQLPTPDLAPTPRTDAEQWETVDEVRCFARTLERELADAKAELKVANRSIVSSLLYNTLKEKLSAAKEECEELLSVNATGAERLRFVLEENSRLRAEVEELKGRLESSMDHHLKYRDNLREDLASTSARAELAEADLKHMQSSALTWARFAGDKAACADIAEQRAQITERLWKEFITLMEITEESDSGNEFRPNKISSCRAIDGKRLNEILAEARRIVF